MTHMLEKYFEKVSKEKRNTAAIALLAGIDHIASIDPSVAEHIIGELKDQRNTLKLIASENYSSIATQLAMGNWLTDKYAEGAPGRRFYAGCERVDVIEAKACALLKELFNADHAYVQPHSGADANLVAFWAALLAKVQAPELEKLGKNLDELTDEEYERLRQLLVNQKVMGMALSAGGHLTHGYRHNISSKFMQSQSYGVGPDGWIDYENLEKKVKEFKPTILIAGYSSYPRLIDFAKMRKIADSVGAILIADMAHFSGLVAGSALTADNDPIPFADFVTSTTHKTLRGPRGGFVLCKEQYKEFLDKGCPMVLGGPLPHVMAAKVIAFGEALKPEFKLYVKQIIQNSRSLAAYLLKEGVKVVTGGTDNHLIVIDVIETYGLNGRQAESLLRECGLTVNRNMVPGDKQGPWYTSGLRFGTPAVTTRGMKEGEMELIAGIVHTLLKAAKPSKGSLTKVDIEEKYKEEAREKVAKLLEKFPLYPELEI